jgi:hypothetical protein
MPRPFFLLVDYAIASWLDGESGLGTGQSKAQLFSTPLGLQA